MCKKGFDFVYEIDKQWSGNRKVDFYIVPPVRSSHIYFDSDVVADVRTFYFVITNCKLGNILIY